MKELEYPFDAQMIMRKRIKLKKQLESNGKTAKRIAVLGGYTTHDIVKTLELFLLNHGIDPSFYESEYAQFWQDAMFPNKKLDTFHPDLILILTSVRNISEWPQVNSTREEVERLLQRQYEHFELMWRRIEEVYKCPVVQNNFEYPAYRLFGNKDAADYRGRVNYVMHLNMKFAEFADNHSDFYVNDINYQSAQFGLERWSDPFYWHMYKYALSMEAIPTLAFNISNIIKSIYGKNKKALALDLDNTLWGGIVGDDGVENLELGQETSVGQAYCEFQLYLKQLRAQGVLLNVISKNEYDNAIAGLKHPQMILHLDDFISIKANWEPKSENLKELATELNLLPEAFVFVDDNPAERENVRQLYSSVGIPALEKVENYIAAIDRCGYFEVTSISKDDLKRNDMYRENLQRSKLQNSFSDYGMYLKSLEMNATIRPFEPLYYSRIAQLTNKSNQFNLTTKRYSQEEIAAFSEDPFSITLYGALQDRFGDNGIIAVTIGKIHENKLSILLWLMSCRVLKRDMEYAMLDELIQLSQRQKIDIIEGHYYPTPKNGMVRDFYKTMGFKKIHEDENGNTDWELNLTSGYKNKNTVITVNGEHV